MNCPNCNETLMMTERQGVEIDYCPKCRGVWLDKGELDKIIEKSASLEQQQPSDDRRYEQPNKPYPTQGYDPYYDKDRYKHDPYYKHKKKKGFLGDLFDFD